VEEGNREIGDQLESMTRHDQWTRREVLAGGALGAAAWLGALPAGVGDAAILPGPRSERQTKEERMEKLWVFVGTSTGGKSKGIYRFTFDPGTGAAGPVQLAAEAANPTFLSIHPNRQFLYAVNATPEFQGQKSGAVSAFALDRKTGALTLLNQQPSGGPGPCHLVVDAAGKNALVANYGGGSVAALPVQADGRLAPAASFIQHHGSSIDPKRQEGPHAHSINLDAGNRFAFAADLGLDKVLVYRFDAAKGTLASHEPPSASTTPGAGPRHFAFHPSGRFAYVINELNSTVTAFSYDAAAGVLHAIQAVTTLPANFSGENYPAEVQVHRHGRFLYGSNRGHDSIAVFHIHAESGRLTPEGHQSSGGKWPRNFGIDPSGAWMIVGNQNSDNVLVFRIDAERGTLSPTGQTFEAPAPICFKMVAMG
jgi:6-phosphogluconolactonase